MQMHREHITVSDGGLTSDTLSESSEEAEVCFIREATLNQDGADSDSDHGSGKQTGFYSEE